MILYTYKYNINVTFISENYIYGDEPSKIEHRAMRKKIAHIAEAQNCMTEALSRGNLNQVGRSAWGSLIDLVQEMVLDEINDARVECSDDEANDLDNNLKHLQATMEKYRNDEGLGENDSDNQLAQDDQCYGQLKTEEAKLKEALELKVNKHTFSQLCNNSFPKYMYTEMYNNRWDLCHGVITTDLTSKQMETFYETAAEDGRNEDVEIDHDKHRKGAMRTISEAFDHPCYYTCSRKSGHTCPLPNQKKTPDVVVAILPDDPTEYLKIPVFVWEVIGKKDIREKGKKGIRRLCRSIAMFEHCPLLLLWGSGWRYCEAVPFSEGCR